MALAVLTSSFRPWNKQRPQRVPEHECARDPRKAISAFSLT